MNNSSSVTSANFVVEKVEKRKKPEDVPKLKDGKGKKSSAAFKSTKVAIVQLRVSANLIASSCYAILIRAFTSENYGGS